MLKLQAEELCLGQETSGMEIMTSGNLCFGPMCSNFRSLVLPAVSLCDAEKVNGWSLRAWFPP